MTHFHMDLGPAEVSQIFKQKGWSYYDGPPGPSKVFEMMQYVIESLNEDPTKAFESCGRLVAYPHPELQGSRETFEVALVIGHVSDMAAPGVKGEMNA